MSTTNQKESARRDPMRIFVLEAPSPLDLLRQHTEARALEEVCRLIGHKVATLTATSVSEFRCHCRFVASIGEFPDKRPNRLCVHIAAHGNSDGLAIGGKDVSWKDLTRLLKPLWNDIRYEPDVILVLSACSASEQQITQALMESVEASSDLRPPSYVFTTHGEPSFADTVVAWALFYHHMPSVSLSDKASVQRLLRRIAEAGIPELHYRRWDADQRKYRLYRAKQRSL